MNVGVVCEAMSPHNTRCSLWDDHKGTHYNWECNCVWEEDGYHRHEGYPVEVRRMDPQ